jgi:hypothetical protein
MPATPITPTVITRAGITPPSFASSDNVNGNTIANNGRLWIELSNTDASSRNATIALAREVDGQAVTPTPHTVAAGEQLRIGPFPTEDYGNHLIVTTDNALLKIAAYTLAD